MSTHLGLISVPRLLDTKLMASTQPFKVNEYNNIESLKDTSLY